MRSLFLFLLFLWIVISRPLSAALPAPVQGKLDNGLRWTILSLPEHKERTDIIVRVYAGGLDETAQQSGGAHMVEHMVFRAGDAHPEGIMPYLLESGWLRGRNYNAYTNHDHTTYLYFPPKTFGLEKTLETAAQMLFHAHITPQELDDERKIVLEEWRMRDGSRRRLWEQRINSQRYGSRYVNRPVIGSKESILTMPAEQLQQYYRDWYAPNNMQILLVGDIDAAQGEKLIARYFGSYAARTLPKRDNDYYEPKLENRLRVDRLGDPQNNQSQVSYLWRFDDTPDQAQTDTGRRERLINRLALRLINQRFRSEKAELPPHISSLSAQKYAIGKHTSALIFSANVEKQAHHPSAQFLMQQIERFKRFPFLADELDKQKAKLLEQLKNDRDAADNYSFEEWTQEMISTVLNDKTYYNPQQIEAFAVKTLPTITLDEVNARIRHWLNSGDQTLQYMPPLSEQVDEISVAMAQDWQKQAEKAPLTAPPDTSKSNLTFAPLAAKGAITQEERFDEQNLVRWTLTNGDKVVWLKSPVAGSKTYFAAQSEAGSHGKGLNDWQAKFALQLIGQNAPNDWQFEQLQEWKETHGIPLVMRMPFNRLYLLSTVENTKLNDLLRYYHANQTEIRIKENVEKAKREFAQRIEIQNNSPDAQRAIVWEKFVYGKPLNTRPTADEVKQITVTELESQWQKIRQAPVTYFLLNNLDEKTVKNAVLDNLGTVARGEPLPAEPLQVLAGSAEQSYPLNPEPRDNIYLSFYNEHPWSVREETKAKMLAVLASQKVVHRLRDETLGVYGARTSVKLTQESGRLHTVITFSAAPQASRRLTEIAEETLRTLPQHITQKDFERVMTYLKQQDTQALKTPDGWLDRLIYGINYADPTYLTNADTLRESITLAEIQELAAKLHAPNNRRVFITAAKNAEKP